MDYTEIAKFILEHPEEIEFGEGVSSEDWIKKAEERLGVIFPPTFVWWLKNYNGGYIYGDEVFSIYEIDIEGILPGGNIVYQNKLETEFGLVNKNELVILVNDQAEIYYFDYTLIDDNGECPIYVKAGKNKKYYAKDIFDFIVKYVENG
jgi:hypothetical protein